MSFRSNKDDNKALSPRVYQESERQLIIKVNGATTQKGKDSDTLVSE